MPDKHQVAELKQLLIDKQQELAALVKTGSEAASIVELDQTRIGRLSRMDALQGQAMSQERQRRRDLQLSRIAAALVRIEHDDYGYCSECGDAIAFQRLKFDPATTLCIHCANERT